MKREDLSIGDTVIYNGLSVVLTEVRGLTSSGYQAVEPRNAFSTMENKKLKPVKTPTKPRYLEIAKSIPEIQDFIAYLRTPEAHCLLGLEARDERADSEIRKQYRDLTGEELVEGEGYHVAPLSAGKQGCEGYVTFNVPAVIPEEISVRMVQRSGLINHLDFLWMLVQEGFRITR